MSTLLATAVATGVMIAGAFIVVFRRMLFAGDLSSVNPEWLSEFSTARYRPMQRLLNEEDYCFLERQPGYPRQMLRKFRAERRAFFRQYLQCLGQDFNQICGAIKLLTLTFGRGPAGSGRRFAATEVPVRIRDSRRTSAAQPALARS